MRGGGVVGGGTAGRANSRYLYNVEISKRSVVFTVAAVIVTILLFSSSSITLAVAVYNLYETGYIEPVAALAMVNMAIIGVAIWLAYRIGGRSVSSREAAPVST